MDRPRWIARGGAFVVMVLGAVAIGAAADAPAASRTYDITDLVTRLTPAPLRGPGQPGKPQPDTADLAAQVLKLVCDTTGVRASVRQDQTIKLEVVGTDQQHGEVADVLAQLRETQRGMDIGVQLVVVDRAWLERVKPTQTWRVKDGVRRVTADAAMIAALRAVVDDHRVMLIGQTRLVMPSGAAGSWVRGNQRPYTSGYRTQPGAAELEPITSLFTDGYRVDVEGGVTADGQATTVKASVRFGRLEKMEHVPFAGAPADRKLEVDEPRGLMQERQVLETVGDGGAVWAVMEGLGDVAPEMVLMLVVEPAVAIAGAAGGDIGRVRSEYTRRLMGRAIAGSFEAASLEEVIGYLRSATRARMVVNWRAMEEAGVRRDTLIRSIQSAADGQTVLRQVLRDAQKAAGSKEELGYDIDDGVVVISTVSNLGRGTVIRVYDLRDVTGIGRPVGSAEEAAGAVKREVDPGGWGAEGGAGGSITVLNGCLIVNTSAANHAAIGERVRRWREPAAK